MHVISKVLSTAGTVMAIVDREERYLHIGQCLANWLKVGYNTEPIAVDIGECAGTCVSSIGSHRPNFLPRGLSRLQSKFLRLVFMIGL